MTEQDVFLEEFRTLRSEIIQSITKQHQILLSGYTITFAVVGYLLNSIEGKVFSGEPESSSFLIIPFVLIGMIALWSVECNRMVRASYYIGYELWPQLSPKHKGWELWIRKEEGVPSKFRKRQHLYQRLVVLLIPLIISSATLFISFYNKAYFSLKFITSEIVLLVFWILLYSSITGISNLAAITPHQAKD